MNGAILKCSYDLRVAAIVMWNTTMEILPSRRTPNGGFVFFCFGVSFAFCSLAAQIAFRFLFPCGSAYYDCFFVSWLRFLFFLLKFRFIVPFSLSE